MKAIILAAGRGVRLRPLTEHLPKCLLEINGVSILENCLDNVRAAGADEAIIVVGHQRQAILDKIGDAYKGLPVRYVLAERYETTNNIVSLQYALPSLFLPELAGEEAPDDVLLLESDVFFGPSVLPRLAGARRFGRCSAAVAPWETGMRGTVVRCGPDGVSEFVLGYSGDGEDVLKTVNLYFLTGDFLRKLKPHLDAWVEAGWTDHYYEAVFAQLVIMGGQADFIPCQAHDWAEVDDLEDLRKARYKFSTREKRYEIVSALHGNFQSYGVQDHCHLYNVHFPPEGMLDHFRDNMRSIVSGYPSGAGEIASALADWLRIDPDCLVVANGASEIIKALGRRVREFCVSTPTFNEYESCADHVWRVPLDPETWEFDKKKFSDAMQVLGNGLGVIVTPNNPTSRAVNPDDIRYVLERAGHVRLVVDESFLDFCGTPSMLPELGSNPRLCVLKSMGKVFGVCGIRLGFLATADRAFAKELRGMLPIWNVNGLAEAFVRKLPAYEEQFKKSCALARQEADGLYRGLLHLGLKAWQPDGNFVLCRMPTSAEEMAEKLFRHDILVKHCGGKTMANGGSYIRFGSRSAAENVRLCRCLGDILGKSQPK